MRKLGKDVSEESSKSKSMQSSAEEDGNSESEIPIPEVEPQSFWWKRYLSKMSFFFSQMFEKKNKKLFFFFRALISDHSILYKMSVFMRNRIVQTMFFDGIILSTILVNSVIMAIENPDKPEQ